MENSTDLLQVKITEARAKLSKESREAIDNVNWKIIILGMNKKYNQDQLENLETETELLLCGILSPENYLLEIEHRMQITKEEVGVLIGEMDKLVFRKIQEGLKIILEKEEKIKIENKPLVFDPRFGNMPKDVQEVIARSSWKEDLYKIAQKYKLTIIQMGSLEEVTIKVISDEVKPYQYESELASKITIPKEDMSNLVNDINEGVLIKIRNLLKKYWDEEANKKVETEIKEEIPLPPYAKTEIKIEEKPIIVETPKPIESVVRNIENPKPQIETPIAPITPIKTIIFPTKKDLPTQAEGMEKPITQIRPVFETPNIQKSMMEEKLKSATVSDHAVSDYSVPKNNTTRPISGDPYREEI